MVTSSRNAAAKAASAGSGPAMPSHREREESIAAITKYLRRYPAGFRSDLAGIIDDEQGRLMVKIPESIRVDAICKIIAALGFEPSTTTFRYTHEVHKNQRRTIQ
jgi:hypothetical protein